MPTAASRMTPGDVMATVVLYHPPDAFLANLQCLLANGIEVLLVDNTPGDYPLRAQLLNLRGPGLSYIGFGANLGISAALNEAGRAAQQAGLAWLLTLDQDSLVAEDYVQSMANILLTIPGPESVGILAPSLATAHPGAETWQSVTIAITSGALMRTSLFERVGWFDESLFIDYVDFDYCLRVRAAGMQILQIRDLHLTHTIGTPIQIQTPLGTIRTLNHAPIRRYYKFRNRVRITQRYFWSHPGWVIRENLSGVLEILKILVMETGKFSKIKMVIRGTADGLRGRFGPAPEALTRG